MTPPPRLRLRSWDQRDAIELAGALVGSTCLTVLLYEELTPLSGGVGFVVFWAAAFLLTYWLMVRQRLGRLAARDRLAAAVVTGIGLILVGSLLQILGYVAAEGWHALRPTFFTRDQFGVGPLAKPTAGGGLAAIVGTLEQVGLATVISVPLGISTAVFLSEIRGRWARPVRILTDAMSGIPSILAGLFIYAILIYSHILPESGFAVSLALAISMLPTVTRTSEVVLRLVPSGLREASLALGGTEWRTTRRIVIPSALTGLVTASILGIARVVGEAAPAIIDAGGSSKVNYNPFKGQQDSLPLMIYNDIRTFVVNEHARAWSAGVVLLSLILVLFVVARVIGARKPGRPARLRVRLRPHPTSPHPTQPRGTAMTVTEILPPGATGPHRAGPASLRTREVHAWFGARHVLADVTLNFEPFQVTALIGPSGCGKSTFLRALNRMHELTPSAALAGTVELDGADIYRSGMALTAIRRRIGMVFQKPNPFPTMSIAENVLSGTRLAGLKVDDKERLVQHSLERAGLWNEVKDRLSASGGTLSGGQQQRLCIARALAVQPEVLLMDEPCSALDPTSTRRIEETIDEICSEVTIIVVTHNMQQAQRVSHQCAFFLAGENQPGEVVEAGATDKIFGDPDDPRTLDYIHGRFG